ncbi:alpha/beta fold hydrolase [Actinosynnema pretiosum subsp. pretiosum]|uniref:Alpha/beta hydrolase fold protein n=2 Tax=Actinosynnema TaxID=40566 RepID=C6WHG5_ACTMD|nr:alpha/beta hydrolase [Actinosynnema mirum]ACU39914.1 alpha/beta hydrolase fold protein [Actinosynnema mirum DSM 43827]QUF02763.1 alpha/beta fold hydrolase [Actinosynnema pretiosum subsp. pretiosum]
METSPLVLLHAFPVDSRMWDGVRERLDPITPDQRAGGEPDLAGAARRVLAELDGRGIGRVVLGGCSMGGYVAMALLRIAPERVAGLVLVDTKAVADVEEARDKRLAVAREVDEHGVGAVVGSVSGLLAPGSPLVDEVRAVVLGQRAEDVAWAQRAMAARPDSTALLREADVPKLVVVGEHDAVTPPERARALAGEIGATCVELAGVGHLSPWEAPGAFADAVLDWRRATGV